MHNTLALGLFYKVYRHRGGMVFWPMHRLEMPLDEGDEISDHSAPRVLDAKTAMAQFRDMFGRDVQRVVVQDGALLSRDGEGGDEVWDFYPSQKAAEKRFRERAEHIREVRAAQRKQAEFNATIIRVGKYHYTMHDAIAAGLKPGWYVQESGCDVWRLIDRVWADAVPSTGGSITARSYRHKDRKGDFASDYMGVGYTTFLFAPAIPEGYLRVTTDYYGRACIQSPEGV
jgi:hypothetical protein